MKLIIWVINIICLRLLLRNKRVYQQIEIDDILKDNFNNYVLLHQ